MDIRLFAPLTNDLVKKYYAHHLALTETEAGASELDLLHEAHLVRALVNRELDPAEISPEHLDAEELGALMAAIRECYRDAIPAMEPLELQSYHARLVVSGYDYFAEPFAIWMLKENIPFTPPEALRSLHADLSEFADVTESIAGQQLEKAIEKAEQEKDLSTMIMHARRAYARPDAEHDPNLHSQLRAHSTGSVADRFARNTYRGG